MVKGEPNRRLVHYLMTLVFTSQTGVNEDKTEVFHATFLSTMGPGTTGALGLSTMTG